MLVYLLTLTETKENFHKVRIPGIQWSTDTESNYELIYSERYIALKRLHNAFLGKKQYSNLAS
jgi:hypothetical protein